MKMLWKFRCLGCRVEFLILCIHIQLLASYKTGDKCPEGQPVHPPDVTDGEPSSIFDDPTAKEIANVIKYMKQIRCFNIKDFDQATINSSYIALVELMAPKKADALLYLDGEGPTPGRYAKVVLYRGDVAEPVIEEYKVGPLPFPTTYDKINRSQWREPVPYSLRSPKAQGDAVPVREFIVRELTKIESVLNQIVGYSFTADCKENCLVYRVVLPGQLTSTHRSMWISIYFKVEDRDLRPVGLVFRVSLPGTNPCNWSVDSVWFRNQTFVNMEQLSGSFSSESPVKLALMRYNLPVFYTPAVNGGRRPGLYEDEEKESEPQQQRGPRNFMPDGRRFTVKDRQVSWQGWAFHFDIRSTTGVQLHDIRFDNQRLVYELSLQEIVSLYSGAWPSALSTVSMESMNWIGTLSSELIPGIDCPPDASFFDFLHYDQFHPKLYRSAACLFEMRLEVPLEVHHYRRNFDGTEHSSPPREAVPDDVLVLRTAVATDWFEYSLDFVFHRNAALQATVSIGNSVKPVFNAGLEFDRFGFQVLREGGVLRSDRHALHFKVDLDIGGRENRFETLSMGTEKMQDMYTKADSLQQKIYMYKYDVHSVTTERAAALNFNFHRPQYLLFHHANVSNSFNQPRAYRLLVPRTQRIDKTESPLDKSMAWTKNQIAVTKQKDDEDTSSTSYNGMDLRNPILNFKSFWDDNESIEDEDLVAWVTVESMYVPHTDVFPSFETTGIDPSFVLQPFNYHEKEPPGGVVDNSKGNSESLPLPELRQRSKRSKGLVCRPVLAKNSDAVVNFSGKQLLLFVLCLLFGCEADFRPSDDLTGVVIYAALLWLKHTFLSV